MSSNSKIKLGNSPAEILATAEKMLAKHKEMGETSPLLALADIDWKVIEGLVAEAKGSQREVEEFRMKSEAKCRERDNALEPIVEAARRSKNLLKTINDKNPKLLGEWGFDVLYTTPSKATATASRINVNSDNS